MLERTAPGPWGHAVLGNFPALRTDPLGLFIGGAREFGDVVRFRFGPRFAHLVCLPEHVKHVLLDNQKNYTKDTRGFRALRDVLGLGLLTSEGDTWLRNRRIAQPAFHRQRIAELGTVMARAAAETADEWQAHLARGRPFDVATEMMRLTLRIVGETLLSADVSGDADAVSQAVHRVLAETRNRVYRPLSIPLAVPTPGNRRFLDAVRALDAIVYRMIAERRRAGSDARADLLSVLLHARDEQTGEAMTDRQLRDEVMTIFLAGHETTANALTWTWVLLSRHPEAGRRLRAELSQVLGGRTPTAEDTARLPYLTMVLDESMRLYPPAWMIGRCAAADDVIDGYRIPAGTYVFISPYVTHRHPRLWENPEGFDPERFSPERAAAIPRYAYFPFGGGPRQCIGNGFATMEALIVLGTLAQRFRLDLAPGLRVDPEPLITLRPRGPVLMTAHPA